MKRSLIGIDLGTRQVKLAVSLVGEELGPSFVSVPTYISYSPPSAAPIHFSCIGESAIERRDHLQLLHPLLSEVEDRGVVLGDFSQHLRGLYQRRKDPLAWGVVSCPATASEADRSLLRMISNGLFDRVLLVDDLCLVAFATGNEEIRQHSVIVDVGHSSIRAGIMDGTPPNADERIEVEFGCDRLVDEFQAAFQLRYPKLQLTDHTVELLKTQLAFVSPARKTCRLRVRYGSVEKVVDVTDLVHEATSTLLQPLLRATREILALCPSDEIAAFQRNILLVGGGAETPGLAARIEQELHADGIEFARVAVPPDPAFITARGAYQWAQRLREEEWEIPFFSFADSDASTL